MRKRLVKFAIGTAVFIVLTLVGLWLIAPIFAKNKAIDKAQALGLVMTVESVNHADGGFLFEGVHLSSTELPFEADLTSILVQADGSKLKSITVNGGRIKVHGRVSEVRDQMKVWKEKHHSSSSGEKVSISLDGLGVDWKSPCGGDDASATNVSVSNSDFILHAAEADGSCLSWRAHAVGVQASLQHIGIEKLEITRVATTGGMSIPTQNDKRYLSFAGSVPEIAIGDLNVDDRPHTLHMKNLLFRGDILPAWEDDTVLGDGVYSKFSFDEMEADLPKIHKVNLGKTEAEIQLSELSSAGFAPFSITVKSDGARGKVQGVTGNRVTFGATELVLHGNLAPDSTWRAPHIGLDETTHVKVEEAQVNVKGEWGPGKLVADVELPDTGCQKLLDAVPQGMDKALTGLKMSGSAEFQLHIEQDEKLAEPIVKLHLFDHCKVMHPPDGADRATLRSSFMRIVQGPMGEGVEMPTGPKSGKWVAISEMSPFLVDAIQVTEDPAFFGHYGFISAAIENSLKTDIHLGKFARGASTVTMQLAKNLWLSREKTIARKIQEAFLTIYLEQTLSKQEILETYFNVVEFGPMIYGIGDAANFYFGTSPRALTLSQALFLTSILPNPKQNWFGPDGKLLPGKQKTLQVLMLALQHRNMITQAEYDLGMTEAPVRGQPLPDKIGSAN